MRMNLAMTPLSVSYGPVLFYGAMTLHGVLVLLMAVAWIRFTQREAANATRAGPAFQFSFADAYAALASLLPWLWLVSLVLRIKPNPDSDAPPPDIAGMVWGLSVLLFFLVCGWLLAVLHRRIIDRGNCAPFAAAFLTTLVLQCLFAAFFAVLSVGYFAVLGALTAHRV